MKKMVLAAGLALSSASCASVSSSSERILGAPVFPPTAPQSVVILRREPRKPHERIGHVFIEPSGNLPRRTGDRLMRRGKNSSGAVGVSPEGRSQRETPGLPRKGTE